MPSPTKPGVWPFRGCSYKNCLLITILVALFLWAALLVRMVASSPSAPAPYSKGPPPCESTPRVLWAPRVVLPNSTDPSAIHISADGKIVKAWPSSREDAEAYAQTRGVSFEPSGIGDVISPGVIDAAAHLAEWLEPPGRSYEGFSSGTQAAAAGGITTVIDLPAHARPLTTTAEHLQRKVEATRGRLHVDVGFWGAALPENLDLAKLSALLRHGALGLTAVVAASPSAEQPGVMPGTRALALAELEVAVAAAAASSKPVLIHAEVVSDDDAGLPAGRTQAAYYIHRAVTSRRGSPSRSPAFTPSLSSLAPLLQARTEWTTPPGWPHGRSGGRKERCERCSRSRRSRSRGT